MQGIMDLIRSVRNLRAERKVQPGQKARLLLRAAPGWEKTLQAAEPHFKRLSAASSVTLLAPGDSVPDKVVSAVTVAAEVLIPLGDLIDFDQEIARTKKELDTLNKEIERAQGKLNNPGFVSKAPPALVEAERQKLTDNQAMLTVLTARLAELEA
jgi:valyl-tRNA synthetase